MKKLKETDSVFFRRYRSQLPRACTAARRQRTAMTLIELMVVAMIGTIISGCALTLMLTVYRSWGQEMRQNEMDWRCRMILNTFTSDCEEASSIVYAGTGSWTLPNGVTFSVPNNFGTVVTAATREAVLQMPSYDNQGIIPNSFDYIAYNWDQTASTITRTVIPTQGSSRAYMAGILPGGGEYDTLMDLSVHQSVTNTWQDPYTSVVDLTHVDAVLFDITVTGTSWGQSATMRLQSNASFRNYGNGGHGS